MKRIIPYAILVLVALTPPASGQPGDLESRAQEFVRLFAAGDYAALYDRFDATMKSVMPPEKIEELRGQLLSQVGEFERQTATRTERVQQYDIVFVTCVFANTSLDIKVVYDSAGKVAGLFFVPPTSGWEPPGYADRSSFDERKIETGAAGWPLPATLTLPRAGAPAPVVVLVHGSGPNDRDESLGPNKPFKDLAWGLASRGVAVLRYDKRTLVYPEKMAGDDRLTVRDEVVDDAVAAVELLRHTEGVDPARVFVLGHSLGATLIPRIAARTKDAAGFIVMAGAARPIEDLIVEQTKYIAGLDGVTTPEEAANIATVEKEVAAVKEKTLSPDTPADSLPFSTPAAYWLDLRGYEPAREARAITAPLLVLQGERDYQVTMTDFEMWKSALSGRKNVTLRSYPGLNHLFMVGKGKSGPAEYQTAGHVDGQVIDDIAEWIEQQ